MQMLKQQKIEMVKQIAADLKKHSTIAILPLENIPDNLLQKVRNVTKKDSKFVIARKSLISRSLKGSKFEVLEKHLSGNFAIILSNSEPSELYQRISSNKLKLMAKPNQIAPDDIRVESGETSIAPGQAVTELKAAGIDVQIQKGKVVISKGKVIVEKGKKISPAVANALKILNIKPFEVAPKLAVAFSNGILFTRKALSFGAAEARAELMTAFAQAYALSLDRGIITVYNIGTFIGKAYRSAVALGLDAKIPEPEITKMLLAEAARQASGLESLTHAEKQ